VDQATLDQVRAWAAGVNSYVVMVEKVMFVSLVGWLALVSGLRLLVAFVRRVL